MLFIGRLLEAAEKIEALGRDVAQAIESAWDKWSQPDFRGRDRSRPGSHSVACVPGNGVQIRPSWFLIHTHQFLLSSGSRAKCGDSRGRNRGGRRKLPPRSLPGVVKIFVQINRTVIAGCDVADGLHARADVAILRHTMLPNLDCLCSPNFSSRRERRGARVWLSKVQNTMKKFAMQL
jgi:hypothetical protein